jgi:hypothetical protein
MFWSNSGNKIKETGQPKKSLDLLPDQWNHTYNVRVLKKPKCYNELQRNLINDEVITHAETCKSSRSR